MTKCEAYWNKVEQFLKMDSLEKEPKDHVGFAPFCDWCNKKPSVLYEDWKLAKFHLDLKNNHSEISETGASVLKALFDIRNPEIKEKVLSSVKERRDPRTGQYLEKITGRYVRDLVDELTFQKQYVPSNEREELKRNIFLENVWILDDFRPKGYGAKDFYGNTSPHILLQCLLKYTEEGDLILDPMAGSGTTIDICNALNRRVIASDLKAWREDVLACDAEKLELKEPVDFIFIHLPYWNLHHYTPYETDLSRLPHAEFLAKINRIASHLAPHLEEGKFLAILIGDIRRQGLIDLTGQVTNAIQKTKSLKLWDKIIVVTKPGTHSAYQKSQIPYERARRFGYFLPIYDTLLVFRKGSQ